MRTAVDEARIVEIYLRSIVRRERKPVGTFRRMLRSRCYMLWIARAEGGVIGFAQVRTNLGGWGLLEYLAVDPSWRSRGAGGRLLTAVATEARATGLRLVAEVDRASTADLPSSSSCAAARERFYRRAGWLPLGWERDGIGDWRPFDYWLPLPGNPCPLNLWTPAPVVLRKDELTELLHFLYRRVYRRERVGGIQLASLVQVTGSILTPISF